ncbi:MAG: histidine--tRNA ligase [bacterium]|nr:histidine--tRNA ligase [bacterium]
MPNVKGTRDLLPPESGVWARVEEIARWVFSLYGYGEIRTPVLEHTELFVRSVGESTDIVGKEMYSFEDRKGRSLTLRPESTAAVARSFVDHRLGELPLPVKLFYIGSHFRYERPQKGRYREFHQIGAELLGDPGPASDAELIEMLVGFLKELGFEDLTVLVHTVGDQSSREAYRQALVKFFEPLKEQLSSESLERLERNPLRILDTKDPSERALLVEAPRLEDSLSAESREHFDGLLSALGSLGVEYRVDPGLVRGLDYYTLTVFEIVSKSLGAQNAIVGGGRYDRLLADLGGPDLPAIGFAIGQDRLIESLPASFRKKCARDPAVHLIAIDPVPKLAAMELGEELRSNGVAAVVDFGGGRMKAALKRAHRSGARYVLLLGEDEVERGGVTCRDLSAGEQSFVPRSEIAALLGNWQGGKE